MWRVLTNIFGSCAPAMTGLLMAFPAQKTTDLSDLIESKPQNSVEELKQEWDANWDLAKYRYGKRSCGRKIYRNIILIRHGTYDMSAKHSESKKLLDIGWQQARSVARFLREQNVQPDIIVSSDLIRAKETCRAVLDEFGWARPTVQDPMLNEGFPYCPEPSSSRLSLDYQRKNAHERIEAAFLKYVHRPPPNQLHDSWDVIVIHGNVIRYFVCRALQIPPEAWLRFWYEFCGITWLQIDQDGFVTLKMMGAFGFLPEQERVGLQHALSNEF